MRRQHPLPFSIGLACWLLIQLLGASPADASRWKILARLIRKPPATVAQQAAKPLVRSEARVAARQMSPAPALPKTQAVPVQLKRPQPPSLSAKLNSRATQPELLRKPIVPGQKPKPGQLKSQHTAARYPPNDGFAGPKPKPKELKAGQVIDRLGDTRGRFAAPAGTATPARALPPATGPRPFQAYVVEKPIAGVRTGRAAANYGQPGGGIQHKLPKSVEHLRDNGFLRPMNAKDPGYAKLNFKVQASDVKPK